MMQRVLGGRARRLLLLAGATACLSAATGAAPALATSQLKEEFASFVNCPTATAGECVIAHTTGGEFQMGTKQVPISKTLTLQGGLPYTSLQTQKLIAPRTGETLSSVPLLVPGGLIGIEAIGGEVTATAELMGGASAIEVNQYFLAEGGGVAVTLPLRIKLSNPLLGEHCYIGSESNPVVLHLSDSDKGKLEDAAKGKIQRVTGNVLEDDTFSVPAASGCGTNALLEPIVTALVNLDAGLPSGSGHNKAVMSGSFEQTTAAYAAKFAKPPKEKKKK